MAEGKDDKKRTVFMLYIPGGAVLGITPAMVLARLEELTETPAIKLFQGTDGVSTGGLITGAMNIRDPDNPTEPKFTSLDIAIKFCEFIPVFFPEIPQRYYKMITANTLNYLEDSVDPLKAEAFVLESMKEYINALKEGVDEKDKKLVQTIENVVTSRWLSDSSKKRAVRMCDIVSRKYPQLAEHAGHLNELTFLRETSGHLSRAFRESALLGMRVVKNTWANNYLFDPEVPKKVFRELFGEARMSDSLRTAFITSYNTNEHCAHSAFNIKSDMFSLEPEQECETSENNPKIWDMVMASTANQFAFPAHETEDGKLCTDKAIVHTPLPSIYEVVERKPDNVTIKLIMLGTGHYFSPQRGNARMSEEYKSYGIVGNTARGQETAELQNMVMSQANGILKKMIGKENIIELSPRLSPRTLKEYEEFPSRNPLDGDAENIKKIINRAGLFIREEDEKIRAIAMMMAENLYNIGQMDEQKFQRIKSRIQTPCIKPDCSEVPCVTSKTKGKATKDPSKPVAELSKDFSVNALAGEFVASLFKKPAEEQDNLKDKDSDKDKNTKPTCKKQDSPRL